MRSMFTGLLVVGALSSAAAAMAAEPGPTCEASKLGTSAKFASCRLKADAKAVKKGTLADFTKCSLEKFTTAEAKAGMGICPSENDETDIQAFLEACTDSVAVALGGGGLPLDVLTCNDDLATCNADLATCTSSVGPMKTGLTQCSDSSGVAVPCTGSGQDAEYQAGVMASYTDNGDGTVTDNVSGLMWEKLSDDGTIHDKDNTYTWANAFGTKIATLNATSFAGYNDWRLPNIRELQSIVNFGIVNPSSYPQFSSGCTGGCTVLTCSCFQIASYWSSTTVGTGPSAWVVFFSEGRTIFTLKTGTFYVRAVRGGL